MKRSLLLWVCALLCVTAMVSCAAKPEEAEVPVVGLPDEKLHSLPVQYDDDKDAADMQSAGLNSQFVEGMMISDLDESQWNLSTMMSIDWTYIEDLQRDTPFHQYVATKAWQATFPGGNVTIKTVQSNESTSFLVAGVAGGETPDITNGGNDNYPLWSKKGITIDMRDYADSLDLYNPEIYDQEANELYKWQDSYPWAVVNDAVIRYYVVYNKTLFDNAGVTTPFEHWKNGNWTWTQFVKTAKEMTTEGSYGFTGWTLFPYFAPYAMAEIQADGTAALNIDNPKYVRYMTEVYNFYHIEQAGRTDWELQNWETLLPLGTDAMTITNMPAYERMVKRVARKDLEADLRIAPLFVFDPNGETQPMTPTSIWGYSISSAAKAPRGAAEYIRLEAMVMKSILDINGLSLLDYLNEDEIELYYQYQKPSSEGGVVTVSEPILGIGDCYNLLDTHLTPRFVSTTNDESIQAIFDSIKPILQSEFDDFNNS